MHVDGCERKALQRPCEVRCCLFDLHILWPVDNLCVFACSASCCCLHNKRTEKPQSIDRERMQTELAGHCSVMIPYPQRRSMMHIHVPHRARLLECAPCLLLIVVCFFLSQVSCMSKAAKSRRKQKQSTQTTAVGGKDKACHLVLISTV